MCDLPFLYMEHSISYSTLLPVILTDLLFSIASSIISAAIYFESTQQSIIISLYVLILVVHLFHVL